MGLKKRSKVSAEFNMSSLTDIIFLLLIFFMLTSSLVVPNALNLKLPSSSNVKQPTSASDIPQVTISKKGSLYWNGRRMEPDDLEDKMRSWAKAKGKKADVLIAPDKGAGVEHVVVVMDIALRYHINAILTPEK